MNKKVITNINNYSRLYELFGFAWVRMLGAFMLTIHISEQEAKWRIL
jgi:hypothetical protein